MKILKSLLSGLLAFVFVYLIGAFISVGFDISKWNEFCRFCIGFVGGIMFLYVSIISEIEQD